MMPGAVMATATVLLLLMLAEATVRWLDGLPVVGLRLPNAPLAVPPVRTVSSRLGVVLRPIMAAVG